MDFLVQSDGTVRWGDTIQRCALGRTGILADKWEGDGGTPVGSFALRQVYYRPDRENCPITALPVSAITPQMGWCDEPTHADYNRLVDLPHPASCETLWREDGIYDLLVVLGHNDQPVVPHRGSAIFLHLIRPDYSPTQGCVALDRNDLLSLLAQAKPGDHMVIKL